MQPFQERIDRYWALPAGPQRKAELDKQIKEFEDWAKSREQRRQQRDRNGKNQNASRDRGGPGPNAGPKGGQRGEDRGRGGDGRDRSVRMRDRLASTSPEQRAKMAVYRRAMEERRKELGLPTRPRWGGFR
jgi:hypothetical protein